jgi:hypothetical protein
MFDLTINITKVYFLQPCEIKFIDKSNSSSTYLGADRLIEQFVLSGIKTSLGEITGVVRATDVDSITFNLKDLESN